ncbi:MAG: N-acetyl-gamma-glutamyl-phosphate reductase [Planctomycetota bacterium]|jgi:N-acetyl-gamma-glutamyl-phosphate reductase
MTRIAIVGATGYAGVELAQACASHAHIDSITLMSGREGGERIAADPRGQRFIEPLDLSALATDFDVVFLCLPHGVGHKVTAAALTGSARVVDLSSDYRFRDAAQYERVYGLAHPVPELCDAAVYGLTEYGRKDIANARLVANPGCYPTASLLGLLPLANAGLLRTGSRVTIDAKSGVSGAGKSPSETTLYGNVNESCRAYGVGTHRHAPEIESRIEADVALTFVPHLLPMFRGMLATIYVEPADGVTLAHAREAIESAYADERFVHLIDGQPATGSVARTNHCHVAIAEANGAFVVTSAIDNLVKGAAGAALQNMNVMLGFDEMEGLRTPDGGAL